MVCQLGLTIGNHPHLFTDCFNYDGMSQDSIKRFKNGCGGISGVLSRIIPKQINGKFSHPYELITAIENDEKFHTNPSIVKYADIINKSLSKTIGYLIVKGHEECRLDERLMKMRDVIVSAKNMVRISAIGAHKGPEMEAVMDANIQYASSQNCDILSKDVTKLIKMYLESRMFEYGDMEAFKISQMIYVDSKNLLSAPNKNQLESSLPLLAD